MATADAVSEIVALHEAVAHHRKRDIAGAKPWHVPPVQRLVEADKTETVIAREGDLLVASFRLDPERGFHGVACFTEVRASIYLLEMAVLPARQRKGIGRMCLEEAARRAKARRADAIRLDTNDDSARAAAFYAACGFREVTRYAETVYLERLL